MVTTAKVDSPAALTGDTGCIYRTTTGPHHWIEHAHAQKPTWKEDEWQLDAGRDLDGVVQQEQVPWGHHVLKELTSGHIRLVDGLRNRDVEQAR